MRKYYEEKRMLDGKVILRVKIILRENRFEERAFCRGDNRNEKIPAKNILEILIKEKILMGTILREEIL